MKFKLSTTLLVVGLICVVLARRSFLANQYRELQDARATLYYGWQHPELDMAVTSMSYSTEAGMVSRELRKYSLKLFPVDQTVTQKLSSALLSNEPVIAAIAAEDLSTELEALINQMPELKLLLLLGATDHAGTDSAIDILRGRLPRIKIHAETEITAPVATGG